ncbi:MAG: hypothetical protein M0P09_01355 [Acholeplasmataceae bacterium]|nr:hypothetical protein [Acholeplasmataceae bacterium]
MKSIFEKKYINETQARKAAEKAGINEIKKVDRFWMLVENEEPAAPRSELEAWILEFQANIEACQSLNAIPAMYELLNQKKGLTETVRAALDEEIGIRTEELEATQAVTGKPSKPKAEPKEWVRQSSILKPTKAVWFIADELYAKAEAEGQPYPTRSQVQDECVRRGIASGTARTQFQHWFKCRKEMEQATRARIEDGQIIAA